MTDLDAALTDTDARQVVPSRAPMRIWQVARRLDINEQMIRRWLIRLDRYQFVGPGRAITLDRSDVVAVVVALSLAAGGDIGNGGGHDVEPRRSTARATQAARCAARHPDAGWIVATPDWAAACDTAEDAIAAWHDHGCQIAAIVDMAKVLAPVADLLEESAEPPGIEQPPSVPSPVMSRWST